MAIFGDDTLHHCVLWKKVSTEMFHAKISSSRAGWTELNWIGIPWSGRNGPKVDGGIKWEGNIDLISCHKLLLRFRFDFIIISILYSKEVILSSSGGGEVSGPLWIVWFKYLLLVCVEKVELWKWWQCYFTSSLLSVPNPIVSQSEWREDKIWLINKNMEPLDEEKPEQ